MPIIFANEVYREFGSGFRSRVQIDAGDWLIVAVVFALICCVLYGISRFMAQRDDPQFYHSPRKLFRQLCRRHQLTRAQRSLLKQLARAQQLDQPASLFVEPDRFKSAARSPAFQSRSALLEELHALLFAAEPQASGLKPQA